jgi:hypothetical protein
VKRVSVSFHQIGPQSREMLAESLLDECTIVSFKIGCAKFVAGPRVFGWPVCLPLTAVRQLRFARTGLLTVATVPQLLQDPLRLKHLPENDDFSEL